MEFVSTIGALIFTFGLLGGALWLLRSPAFAKIGRATPWHHRQNERQLQSIEKLVLGPDCTLHVVAFNGETLLLAISTKTVVTLSPSASQLRSFTTAGGAA
jgi:flagellar biogenesis protein FliO